ncbi:GNAT family N-acetyltransferase [Rhodopirellula bahusiensis]|uniref:GNAT family N-acetyltransferase n=1 Tax=Rhodopirellula bahusiensis TaxID=2014065 RepID=A0A2G1W2P9_9BACT|nr:N-acetyltransferase [Rhodopirellula bahusiensis]PHQ33306.1 GNAT family N-acetyltransferase [Rhodopirellula bahusiensis]
MLSSTFQIRELFNADWPATWAVIEPAFRSGTTFPHPQDITSEAGYEIWAAGSAKAYVAEDESGGILGTYYLKPNQPGRGSHVCNCAYIVSSAARGMGIASKMCEHSQREALQEGYRSMQFNFVVSTNTGAVRLWQKLGFEIVGTLPEAFDHPENGYVDVYVMHKSLLG